MHFMNHLFIKLMMNTPSVIHLHFFCTKECYGRQHGSSDVHKKEILQKSCLFPAFILLLKGQNFLLIQTSFSL